MENNSFEEIWSKLKKCKRVAITLHSGPDGDSFGSCTAMKYVLERDLNMDVTLVSYDPLEKSLSKLSFAKEIEFGKDVVDLDFNNFDAFIALDCSTSSMLGKLKQGFQLPKNLFVINIDHHYTNEHYGNLNYVDASAPSACSVLIDLFKNVNVKFDHDLCVRLLVGLCT